MLLAGLNAVKRREGTDFVSLDKVDITYAMSIVKPSAMREVQLEVPKVLYYKLLKIIKGADNLSVPMFPPYMLC